MPADDARVRVLLIDDDEEEWILTRELLEDVPGRPYRLDWTPSYSEGLEALCGATHDVYLLDFRLGVRTGIELLREAHARSCSGPVILLTGQGQSRTDLEALDAGADDYLEKDGLKSAWLDRAIRYAMVRHRAEAELERKVRERTEELAQANAALREADRRKDEFLAMLAHELRNPLAPICNTLEILRLVHDDEETRPHRERLSRQVGQLQRLVDDLLDVSRMTTGKLQLSPEPLTIQEVVEAAIETSRPRLEKASLTLVADLPEEPVRLHGDRIRLAQVFTNLLNNAAKFSDPGGTVRVAVRPTEDHVEVSVRDTGVGIQPEMLPKVFTLFTQVDRSLNRSQGGLGIGLSLVRQLVEMHGGKVLAHSDGPGRGATFTVSLPRLDSSIVA